MAGTQVTRENKMILRYVAKALGGSVDVMEEDAFDVTEIVHDDLPLEIDIISFVGHPEEGLCSYSTLGLSDHPMMYEEGEFPTRLEIVGLMDCEESDFSLVLASAAFRIIRTHELVYPGRVMEDYVAEYYPDTGLPHLYFTDPFIWDDRLKTLDCGTKQVSFLLAMPISDAELDYLLENGDEAFDGLLSEKEVDVAALDRNSVV